MNDFASRRDLLKCASLLAASPLLVNKAWANKTTWPTRAIKVIVPFSAGGGTDVAARIVSEALSKRLGQSVIVENKTGASGILGTDAVAKSASDGYTFLVTINVSLLNNQFLYSKLPYDPLKDFLFVSQIALGPVVLVAHPSVPAGNMRELLNYIKSNKSKLSYGSWGAGTVAHLLGAYMSKSVDGDMAHVAYKGESAMLQDLLAGRVQMAFSSALNVKSFIDAGKLKAIGVNGVQRITALPNVSTISEQGVNDDAYKVVGWIAMAAPAGTPADVIAQISGHLKEVAHDANVKRRIDDMGFQLVMNSAQAFKENYQRDFPVWKSLVEISGAKLG